MLLEARSPNCCSSRYVLKLNGRAHGGFRGRWFSEGVDIRLSGRRKLHLEKSGWMRSHFVLVDAVAGTELGNADRAGVFTSRWNLQLSTGPAEMVASGFFKTGYVVEQGLSTIATADRIGFCEGGWKVESANSLQESDLILVGLIYHTLLRRRQSSSAAAGGAAAGS